MVHDVIATCPVCSGELTITRLHCRACGTALEGEFGAGRFGRLDREQLSLLESFLRSRGNLKEMERELGISYPTVRAPRRRARPLPRLRRRARPAPTTTDEVLAADEDQTDTARGNVADSAERREILERLAREEITAPRRPPRRFAERRAAG